jgi:histidine triad (HIT) family protein
VKNSCVFCQIIKRELAGSVVFEDDISLAILDHRPLFPGHTLLMPRIHFETLADLPEAEIGQFFANVQLLAKAVEIALTAEGSFVALNNRVSQSVPHLHIHIVPRRRRDGLKGFFWPRNKYQDDEHMKNTQIAIKQAISDLAK